MVNKNLYKTLMDNIPFGVIFIDAKNERIQSTNPAFYKALGYTPSEVLGRNWTDFIIEKDNGSGALKCLRKDGSLASIKGRMIPVINGNSLLGTYLLFSQECGQVSGLLTKSDDSSVLLSNQAIPIDHRIEDNRITRLAKIGELVGGIAHELRNPLQIIKNSASLIELVINKEKTEPEKIIQYLKMIHREAEVANRIITNILLLAQENRPNCESVIVPKLFDAILVRFPLPENIRFSLKIPEFTPSLFVDPEQITIAILNIITNACQAMPQGGKIEVSIEIKDQSLLLRITDTGPGIPKDIIGKIFEPLFTTKKGGLGLGLAIAKRLVEANAGQITVESVEKKEIQAKDNLLFSTETGTTFIIELPTVAPVQIEPKKTSPLKAQAVKY